MFAALVLPNLLAFVLGQLAAFGYLRTGRFWLGLWASCALWLLLDWWLVAKFVYDAGEPALRLPAGGLQGIAAWTSVAFVAARWRRRWSAAARLRRDRFAAGLASYLRSDYQAAGAMYTRLLRTDPWDAAAWIALGDVHRRSGRPRRAVRCYRRAAAVDVAGDFSDLLRLLRPPRAGG